MKTRLFLALFVCIQIFFIFFHLHKQSSLIELAYQKQKNETVLAELIEQRKQLTHELQTLKNPSLVKKFAQEELHMEPIKMSALKKVSYD